jgi:hypothetical protein
MKTQPEITTALNAIRALVDIDVMNADISDVQNKCLNLTQMMGLSSETTASAKKLLGEKEVEVFITKDLDKLAPQKAMKLLKSYCSQELATLEYAERLNSSIVHSIDALRSVMSLYKTEMQNGLKQ